MAKIDIHLAVIRIVFSVTVVIAALATYGNAHAQTPSEQIRLGIAPVNVQGNFFDLTIEPGETRQLVVELSNHGTTTVSARTFAADAYTIHGGGFGAKLDGEPISGTTRWIDYPTSTLDLDPAKSIVRTFTIGVPKDAQPGQYITSLVIQNAVPIAGDGDGVSLNQVNRQAIAVNITVPGSTTPGLTIGAVAHHVAGVASVVSFNVRNTGDVHLKPSGEFVLRDDGGVEITRYPVVMDSFYAGMETQVEVPFGVHLDEGTYIATLTLSDDQYGINATSGELTLVVPKAVETIVVPAGEGSGVAQANQQSQAQQPSSEAGFPISIIYVTIGSVVAGIGIGITVLRLTMSRRMRGVPSASAEREDVPTPNLESPTSSARRVSVKQLIPRSTVDRERIQTSSIHSSTVTDGQ